MGLSGLLFVFVAPLTTYRLVVADWKVFALDLFLISSAAFIFTCAYKQKYIHFSQYYMCLLVSLGAAMTVMLAGPAQIYWIYPASLTMFFLTSTRIAYLYVVLMCSLIAPTLLAAFSTMELINVYVALFGTTAFISVFASEIKSENRNLDLMAMQDYLTNSGNRRGFDNALNARLQEAALLDLSTCLVVMDIDNFKSLNDNYGHSVGDAVLKHLVATATKVLRKTDKIYRIGGEEFAILMADASLEDARVLAEKIRKKVEDDRSNNVPAFTVSLGISSLLSGESGYDWLKRADMAMYQAKRNGKNQVVVLTEG